MLRVPIRDLSSPREVKPRVFDALICEDKILLDVKDSKKGNTIIPLADVLVQISEAEKKLKKQAATEP